MDMNESTFGKLVKVQRSRSWLITILFSLGFTMNYSMYVYNMYNYIYIYVSLASGFLCSFISLVTQWGGRFYLGDVHHVLTYDKHITYLKHLHINKLRHCFSKTKCM